METPEQNETTGGEFNVRSSDLLGGNTTQIAELARRTTWLKQREDALSASYAQEAASLCELWEQSYKRDMREVLQELDRRNNLLEAMAERMVGEGLDRCQKCGTFAQVQRLIAGHSCQDVCIGCQVTPNAISSAENAE